MRQTTASSESGVASSAAACDDGAHGRIDRANHFVRRNQGAQPVREVNNLGRAMPGNRYFAPPETPATRAGKTGPQMRNMVVLGRKTIEGHPARPDGAARREIGNVARGNRPSCAYVDGVVSIGD